ncbi:MAG: GIY-YIG nuclease family protein [Chloroflexi bacterium]|nr:GIY-YIG nuclease family protein [Chloroflexota bacterium]
MSEQAHRRELREQYRQTQPEAGVYRIVNSRNGKCLLGSTTNLAGIRNRMEFAKSSNLSGALDLRLRRDIREDGLEAFSLEVLEVLEIRPEMTPAQIREDLATLEALWREKLDPELLY